MLKWIFTVLSVFWVIGGIPARADSSKTCVLIFERRIHPFTQVIHGVFDPAVKAGRAIVIDEAVPVDMLKCVDAGASEIVMVVHAAVLDPGYHRVFQHADTRRGAEVMTG